MKNDTRNNVSAWRIGTFVYGSVSVCLSPLLVVSQAYADVPTPPPAYHKQIDTSFPSGKALLDQGYNPNTGVLRVEGQKTGKPTVTSNGQTVTGTQNARVVVTDQYGNKGTMTTKITQTANAVVIANVVGNSLGNGFDTYEKYISDQIKDGNYSGAAETVFASFARSLDELSGGNLSRLKRWSGGDGAGLIDQHDKRMSDYYNGGGNPSSPSTGNPSSPSTGNPSSPSTGTPTSPGNPSNPSSGGGGSSSGLGSAANAAGSAQRTSEKNGDVSGATGNAAFKKAADAAANAEAEYKRKTGDMKERLDKGDKIWFVRLEIAIGGKSERKSVGVYTDKRPAEFATGIHAMGIYNKNGELISIVSGASSSLAQYVPKKINGAHGHAIASWGLMTTKNYESVIRSESILKKEDMTLTAEEIKQILQRMFASQQTNHQEMMRQLSQIAANTAPNTSTSTETTPPSTTGSQVIRGGDSVVDQATTSRTVSTSEAISAPFTPAGSNVAGRTKFTLNSDGSVTTTFVPDTSLKPHSSQAPTRVSAAPASSQTADATTPNIPGQTTPTTPSPTTPDAANPTQTIPNQPGSQQNQEQRDFCQQNPNAAACMELGNGDYEDLDVPESELDLNFEPADIFQTDGVCPEPKTVDLGMFGTVEFSYQMLCDFASKIRPILVAMTVLFCAYFAYESVREL